MEEEDFNVESDEEFEEDNLEDEDDSDPEEKIDIAVEDEMTLNDDVTSASTMIDSLSSKLSMLQTPKVTSDIMTRYEQTRVLGLRTKQLILGAKPLVNINKASNISEKQIALQEFHEKKLPFIIRRYISRSPDVYEDWKLSEFRMTTYF